MLATKNNNFKCNASFPMNVKIEGQIKKNLAFNQLIPNEFIDLQTSISEGRVVKANTMGTYITKWIGMENRVGHRVHVKVDASRSDIRLCWYKSKNEGYDFATGALINQYSYPEEFVNESIYTFTSDMVWTDGYAQLYYYLFDGLEGDGTNFYFTIQLTDLDELGWRDMDLAQFKLLFPNNSQYRERTNPTISELNSVKLNDQELTVPLLAIPDESTMGVFQQLIKNTDFENTNDIISTGVGGSLFVENNELHFISGRSPQINFTRQKNKILNHKYLISLTYKSTKEFYYSGVANIRYNESEDFITSKQILTLTSSSAITATDSLFNPTIMDSSWELVIKAFNVIDLTLLYGTNKEPSVDTFKLDFPREKYAFNLGENIYRKNKISDFYENGKIIQRIGKIDLGTVNFTREQQSTEGYYRFVSNSNITNKAVGFNNVYCARYTVSSSAAASDFKEKQIKGFTANSRITLRDDKILDTSALKDRLSGVYLYFEHSSSYTTYNNLIFKQQKGNNKLTTNLLTSFDLGYQNIISFKKGNKKSLYLQTAASILPDEYQEVEYIESTGTQWIDTNILINSDTNIEYDLSFKIKLQNNRVGIIGVEDFWYNSLSINAFSNGFVFANSQYPNRMINYKDIALDTVYKVKVNKEEIFVNGNAGISLPDTNTPFSNKYVLMPHRIAGGTRISSQYYYVKIIIDNVLVRDFIPCYRKSDNVIGMYDLVSNQFFTNQGTGDFIVGSNVYRKKLVNQIKKNNKIYYKKPDFINLFTQLEYLEVDGEKIYLQNGIVPVEREDGTKGFFNIVNCTFEEL